MGYRTFGTSGLRVPELFLAAMTFGEQGPGGWRSSFGVPAGACSVWPSGPSQSRQAGAR
jgi:aryl-alcohol dehydrogenase-like predicted oxidoreductase